MQFFASCPPGVADLTAAELRDCGATQTREFKLGVQFEGTLETAYRACLWSRTASRILMPLGDISRRRRPKRCTKASPRSTGREHVAPTGTLAIEFGGSSSGITHTHFGALKTKDAIVDQFRERTGERPSVELEQPDVRIDVRLDRDRATVSLDLSGESLHRRAYRARGVAAPLKENLAAAVLLAQRLAGDRARRAANSSIRCAARARCVIEAAMMALDIAPGLLRSYFGFIGWRGHDRELVAAPGRGSARSSRAQLRRDASSCAATTATRRRFVRRSRMSSARSCAASCTSSDASWSS